MIERTERRFAIKPKRLVAAAQTRIVSVARIRLDSWKFVRPFKGIFCADISEFESYHPRQAVGKRGNKYLRTLFVQAAHVVLARRPSAAMRGLWPWIEQASKRLHRNMLAIALANKLARIAWAVLVRGRSYQPRIVLKRASASRTSGEWREDDFDVLADGVVVGRIMKAEAPHSAEGDMRALNEGSGFDPKRSSGHMEG